MIKRNYIDFTWCKKQEPFFSGEFHIYATAAFLYINENETKTTNPPTNVIETGHKICLSSKGWLLKEILVRPKQHA